MHRIEVDRVQHGQAEHHQQDHFARKELSAQYFPIAQRIGVQQLDGPELPLLGEQSHRQEWKGEQQTEADVGEQQLPVVLDDVLGEGDGLEKVQIGPRVQTRHESEQPGHDIDQRKGKVRLQFLAADGQHPARRKADPHPTSRNPSGLASRAGSLQGGCAI